MELAFSETGSTPKLCKQKTKDTNDDDDADYGQWLSKWLFKYKLSHLYELILTKDYKIGELCQLSLKEMKSICANELNLSGNDLASFISSLIDYSHLKSSISDVQTRTNEVNLCVQDLEYKNNELQMKKENDITYIHTKFSKIIRTLQKREKLLIKEYNKKIDKKQKIINKHIKTLKEYHAKLDKSGDILHKCDRECAIISDNTKMSVNVVLNEAINYNKHKMQNINKIHVEISNHDTLVHSIKRLGVVIDQHLDAKSGSKNNPKKSKKRSKKNDGNDGSEGSDDGDGEDGNTMLCLCGAPLVLTLVEHCYLDQKLMDKIYCNFCNERCDAMSGISLNHNTGNSEIYHCPKGDIKLHPGGFDLCYFCGSKCFEARLAEKQRQKIDRKLKKNQNKKANQMHRNLPGIIERAQSTDSLRHKRAQSAISYKQKDSMYSNFMYPGQLKRLTKMGYDPHRSRKLIIKYQGNMTKVMQELMI